MRSINILAKYAVCLGAFSVLALQVLAQAPPAKEMQQVPNQDTQLRKGNSGKQHGESKGATEPIVDNWTIKEAERNDANGKLGGQQSGGKVGTAKLTLDPNGSWDFSGSTERGFGMCHFNIVFGVKSSEGTVVAFKHSAYLNPKNAQSFTWQKKGQSPVLKKNFKAFAKDHDWYGSRGCGGAPNLPS